MTARSRSRLVVVAVYAGLVVASPTVRSRHDSDAAIPSDRFVIAHAVDGERLSSDPVRIAYREYAPASVNDVSGVIVLIHGSPGHKEDFDGLGPILGERLRVIAPDLPGFGASSHTLPDYSFRAHAIYIHQLLDALGIGRAHLLGYSMGGGVALSFAALWPERLASSTMLSAIGVQEMELAGDYYVNHAVHAAQLLGLWILTKATPQMGLFDHSMLDIPYARNFYDSDQRPLRGILRRLEQPTLIIHGTHDDLVPYDAALEHHRLVPQSELVTLDGGHFELFRQPQYLAAVISSFIDRAEQGTASLRATSTPERMLSAAPLFGTPRFPHVRGIAASVLEVVITTTSLASGTVAAAAAGALVADDRLDLAAGIRACFIGMFIAGMLACVRVRRFQPGVLAGLPSRWRSVAGPMTRPAWRIVVTGALVYAAWAGFTVSSATAFALLFAGIRAGRSNSYVRATILLTVTAAMLRVAPLAITDRGRRLLLSRWRRVTRWEFWPPWVFYPPVVCYILYLMVKHRSVTLFTAANPAIVAGGVVGESKYAILQALAGSAPFVARARLIGAALTPKDKVATAAAFMADEGLAFPVVLKPNQGQRGSGVVVVRSEERLRRWLSQSTVDTIIQEYAGGPEFGVFYYRHPSEARGHILSVTEKTFPTVIGDGRQTLEALILHDDRAVCSARFYLDRHEHQLTRVPADAESVPLVELGTHCRGSMFLDGAGVMTADLEAQLDGIARDFEGFYFGRFDIRASAGVEAFRRGEAFKIIELNGVTSEATHIYHPGTPLGTAYRVLMEQWRIAFEIGEENHAQGVAPASMRKLVALIRDYRQIARAHLVERPMT